MVTFKIEQLLPRFIVNDTTGHAMAKAIEAGLNKCLEACQDGVDCVIDVDKMPEWRLDEMAWELNCLYEYDADIDTKRRWIANAVPYYSIFGTLEGVYQFLRGRYETVGIEEWWQYGADPFHFRVILTGEYSEEALAWAEKAVATTKNVRSVLDYIQFNSASFETNLNVAAAVCGIEIAEDVQMV